MMYIITTVRDRLTGCNGLVLVQNEDIAKRSFIQAVRDDNSLRFANKEDFDLLYLGDYFPDDGKINVLSEPKVLLKGSDIGEVSHKI